MKTYIQCILFFFPLIILHAQAPQKRPMTFTDILEMRSVASPNISPDGKWMLYTLSTPDWKSGKSYTDIYLVSLDRGVGSTRQMTFSKEKNESSPQWARDNRSFAFLSNREAPEAKSSQNQLYYMRMDGGEAMKISNAKEGVGSFTFSKNGAWLAFTTGKEEERQLWIVSMAAIDKEKPTALTKHIAPILTWQFSPDSKRIYFTSADSLDKANRDRKEKKFDVKIRNEESPTLRLWALDIETKKEAQLTTSEDYSVSDISISDDSKWIGFKGTPNDRYIRGTEDASEYTDLYLLEVSSGSIERLTNNTDIGESTLRFSPDNSLMAFSAEDDFQYFHNEHIYARTIAGKGNTWKKLGADFDGDLNISFWSNDSKTLYCNAGVRATNQLMAISIQTGKVTQVTSEASHQTISKEKDSGVLYASFSNPIFPDNYFYIPGVEAMGKRNKWVQLTDSNPQVDSLALGTTEAVQWKSTDGTMIEGILVKPLHYEKGKRYPLVVQIHGGPAGVDILRFNGRYINYSHVYAAGGYFCLLPNYRGSTNYGERFKMQIGGDYFRQAFDDIMSGVDHLVRTGLVDSTKMGVMGWSAGGHWSNWILTHTDRFKAISSGAGAVNWTSMYAETDVQRNREFYFNGKPYDNFDHYWNESPLKYIKNAKTPTLIHVVDGDPRVPRPQSEELHMALKKLGVPTEFFVYPGSTHGITDARNQMVKMVSEYNWFEKWLRGKKEWFDWKDLLSTIKEEKDEKKEDK
jgi:dipeptidyl aminopeptidase/acylaminoacyl peptidase